MAELFNKIKDKCTPFINSMTNKIYTKNNVTFDGSTQKFTFANPPIPELPLKTLAVVAMVIDNLYAPNYSDIKRNPVWRQIYQCATRRVLCIEGTNEVYKSTFTMPCHYCGVVLTIDLIEVDHFKPQEGGDVQAVLKVFRSLNYGLTVKSGTGAKARILSSHQSLLENAIGSMNSPFTDISQHNLGNDKVPTQRGKYTSASDIKLTAPRDQDKDNLTPLGSGILRALDLLELHPVIIKECMNSFVNLVPSCGSCNKFKGNKTERLFYTYY